MEELKGLLETHPRIKAARNRIDNTGNGSFIVDNTDTIYYDPDGTGAGYVVVADLNSNAVALTDVVFSTE